MTARRIPTTQLHVTAHHEAGHAVTAIALKLTFTKVDIIRNDDAGLLGRIYWPDKLWRELRINHTDPRIISLTERRLVSGFAGALAQRRFAPWSNWRHSSTSDRKAADELLQRLIGGPFSPNDPFPRDKCIKPFPDDTDWCPPSYRALDRETLDAYHADYSARAKVLVDQFWSEIQIVAAALLERKTLSCAEVRKLMTGARRIPRSTEGGRYGQ